MTPDKPALGPLITEARFVWRAAEALEELGFSAENSIACVSVCRDELCRSLARRLRRAWGEAFSLGGLAAMLHLGRAGFGAGLSHAPVERGRERYVLVVMPHIGLLEDGTVGWVRRPGQTDLSTACGALCVVRDELATGRLDTRFDPLEPELSLLKRRIARALGSHGPDARLEPVDILTLTQLARAILQEDLEALIAALVRPEQADWAVLTGIQVHGPGGDELTSVGPCYAVVDRQRIELNTLGG